MNIQNVKTEGLNQMQTKDALNFLNTLLTNKNFTGEKTVCTGLHLVITDKKFPKMDNVTLLVQTFDGKNEEGKYFYLTQSRGNDSNTSNCVMVEETDKESWLREAYFIKRYNELV